MAKLIRARHDELDVVCEVPDTDWYLTQGWTAVDDDTPITAEVSALYDPSAHNADEVTAYLAATVDEAERQRVIDAESQGQARKTVLDWQPPA
jgi:hypothetical protein